MKKISWEPVGKAAKKVGETLVAGLVVGVPVVLLGMADAKCNNQPATYSGAVDAIMHSDMLGSYKREAVALLKPDAGAEVYKSVISIVKSDALGSYKVDMIERLFG